YGRDLEKDCVSETSGHFKRLLVSMCQVFYIDTNQRIHLNFGPQELYQAGEKRWGTDESKFNMVLASQSFPQLRAVFDEYAKIAQRDIEQSISREMSGYLQEGFKTIMLILYVKQPTRLDATHPITCFQGLGTDDDTLIRVIVTRCEIDMRLIKTEFQHRYNQTLEKWISVR
ncbi:hypothetical protein EGW08_020601, partial [Elysia chlorotica]